MIAITALIALLASGAIADKYSYNSDTKGGYVVESYGHGDNNKKYDNTKSYGQETKKCASTYGGNPYPSDGGDCTGDEYRCPVEQGAEFQRCDHGKWVTFQCGDGTTCNSDLIAKNVSPCFFPIVGKCDVDNTFKCQDDTSFLTCNFGQWIKGARKCPDGTKCKNQKDAAANPCVV